MMSEDDLAFLRQSLTQDVVTRSQLPNSQLFHVYALEIPKVKTVSHY